MERSIRDHFRVVWNAARSAAEAGFWNRPTAIGGDVNEHVTTLLGVLVGGDGKLTDAELELFNELFAEVLGGRQPLGVLRALLKERTDQASKLTERVPAFFESIVQADAAAGTRVSQQVLESLQEIARSAAAMDGDIRRQELVTLTDYTWLLRRAVEEGVGSKAAASEEKQEEESLEALQQKLHRLVGLDQVKQRVDTLINTIRVRQLRQKHDLPVPPISLHMVFTGNPGTGKTTVARLMSKILKRTGVLPKGQMVEVDRSGLVAGYVGQTALKVTEKVKAALGGVLFIDEAYALVAGRGESDFGHEAVDVLVKAMEDNRDNLILIVAGYPAEMREFVDSNPGLRSRFSIFIEFEDYDAGQMLLIFERMVQDQGYALTAEARSCAEQLLRDVVARKTESFANARDARNFFERCMTNHANRLARVNEPTKDQLMSLTHEDLSDA